MHKDLLEHMYLNRRVLLHTEHIQKALCVLCPLYSARVIYSIADHPCIRLQPTGDHFCTTAWLASRVLKIESDTSPNPPLELSSRASNIQAPFLGVKKKKKQTLCVYGEYCALESPVPGGQDRQLSLIWNSRFRYSRGVIIIIIIIIAYTVHSVLCMLCQTRRAPGGKEPRVVTLYLTPYTWTGLWILGSVPGQTWTEIRPQGQRAIICMWLDNGIGRFAFLVMAEWMKWD